ncbi:MAG TPA: PIG-L family deacetylase [Bryobacteraceae bacterium]|nr:PIG-L family deacetylase [Bryobacteraceae bacterium]
MPKTDRCLIVAAHPDDETVGAGIWMKRRGPQGLTLLHITDGSPRDMEDAGAAGYFSREEYANARRQELYEALGMAGIRREQFRQLPFVDKEAYLHLPEIVDALSVLAGELEPELILSPAYEGGHPDHDSAAFAVAMARLKTGRKFRHLEYRLYHAGPDGGFESEDFLPFGQVRAKVLSFTPSETREKSRMLESFGTQRRTLAQFCSGNEQFREAPAYDFTRAPHQGRLLYEQRGWGITGEQWRSKAREVLDAALARS